MCYFINLSVRPQRPQAATRAVVEELARKHGLHLLGDAPEVQITDGRCSCRQVAKDGRGIHVAAFLEELVRAKEVKNVKVGWTWVSGQVVQMPPGTAEQRLSLQDFLESNQKVSLMPEIWYRLHNQERYKPEP